MGFRFVNVNGRDMHEYLSRNLLKSLGKDYITLTQLSKEFGITWETLEKIRRVKSFDKPWSRAMKRHIVTDDGARLLEWYLPKTARTSLKSMLSSPWYKAPRGTSNEEAAKQLVRGLWETRAYRNERDDARLERM